MAQTHIWQLPGHEQLFLVLVPPLEESLTASQKRATVWELGQCGPGRLVDSAWRELLSPAHSVVDSAVPGQVCLAVSVADLHSAVEFLPTRRWLKARAAWAPVLCPRHVWLFAPVIGPAGFRFFPASLSSCLRKFFCWSLRNWPRSPLSPRRRKSRMILCKKKGALKAACWSGTVERLQFL